ncbi:hypothetical protein Taro_054667, partial [Colocasia esculenta]|nr:hypothetical protein [Colocasia esculenta]
MRVFGRYYIYPRQIVLAGSGSRIVQPAVLMRHDVRRAQIYQEQRDAPVGGTNPIPRGHAEILWAPAAKLVFFSLKRSLGVGTR